MKCFYGAIKRFYGAWGCPVSAELRLWLECANIWDMRKKSTYTPKIGAEICERLAEGEPLRKICRDPHMPAWRTVYDWIKADSEFATRIAHARMLGFDAIAEEALEIADTPMAGEEIEDDGEKVRTRRGDMLGHRKLRVETRLKLLAKWCPAKYGDRTAMELTGANGGPVRITDTERAARIAAILAAAQARKAKAEGGGESEASSGQDRASHDGNINDLV
jgi:hypothetical protein